MKKITSFLVATIIFVAAAAQKLNNQQIYNIILKSKEANQVNGITDPNKIAIGQKLTFLFPDKYIGTITAEAGDSQWKILGTKLSKLIAVHGDPVVYRDTPNKKPLAGNLSGTWLSINPWLLLGILLFAIAVFVILRLFSSLEKQKKQNAETHPMVASGISDKDAVQYMGTVAARAGYTRFGPTTKGRLTTSIPVRVAYANGNRMEIINNEHVFHSKARRTDGTACDIFFKQVCGNDASEINMQHATFIPDEVQTTELQTANHEMVQKEITAAAVTTDKVSTNEVMKTVCDTIAMQETGKFSITVENGMLKIDAEFSNPIASAKKVEESVKHTLS